LVDEPELIRGKRALVVEDGPTLTHGGMSYGAGWFAAQNSGAVEIVDPVPYAVGSIKDTYEAYPNSRKVLPAMGYGEDQIRELEATINAEAFAVLPPDLQAIVVMACKAANMDMFADFEARNGQALQTLIQEHGVELRPFPDEVLAELIEKYERDAAFNIAYVLAYRNEADRAFEWLEKALAKRSPELLTLRQEPEWDPIREDPRFAELISRISYYIEE